MCHIFSRRSLLRSAAMGSVAAVASVAYRGGASSAVAQTPVPRTGGAWLKTSLNAYSFSKPLNDAAKMRGSGGMSLFQLLEYCAEQNFDAVDPTGFLIESAGGCFGFLTDLGHAGSDRSAVHLNRASAAQRHAAPELRSRKPDRVPENPQERSVGLDVHGVRFLIDAEG